MDCFKGSPRWLFSRMPLACTLMFCHNLPICVKLFKSLPKTDNCLLTFSERHYRCKTHLFCKNPCKLLFVVICNSADSDFLEIVKDLEYLLSDLLKLKLNSSLSKWVNIVKNLKSLILEPIYNGDLYRKFIIVSNTPVFCRHLSQGIGSGGWAERQSKIIFVPCSLDVGQGREGVTLFLIRLTTFNIVLLFTSSDWRKWTYLVNGSLRVGDLKTKFSCNLRIATGSKYHSYETTSQQRSWMEFGKYNSFKRQSTPL